MSLASVLQARLATPLMAMVLIWFAARMGVKILAWTMVVSPELGISLFAIRFRSQCENAKFGRYYLHNLYTSHA